MRPSKLSILMSIAENISELSHDLDTKVGAVLIREDNMSIIATGYNGFVRGAKDLDLPRTRPEKYQYILHAEENLILNCAMNGIAMNNTFIVCTMSPCIHCMRLLFNAGIKKVIIKEKYRDFESILTMKDIKIEENITQEGFVELTYVLI